LKERGMGFTNDPFDLQCDFEKISVEFCSHFESLKVAEMKAKVCMEVGFAT
jgi:hypothetical protein